TLLYTPSLHDALPIFVREEPRYSREYLDPEKRSIANSVQVFFADGTATENVEVEYPLGHRRRRKEGIPLLVKKFEDNTRTRFVPELVEAIAALFQDVARLEKLPVNEFVEVFVQPQWRTGASGECHP